MVVAAQLGISRELLPLPGDSILETIEEHGLSVEAAAQKAQITPTHLKKAISGAQPISKSLAKKLARIFGNKESFWINLQKDYDYWLQKFDEADGIDAEKNVLARLQKSGLLKHLEKRNVVAADAPTSNRIIALRGVFGLDRLEKLAQFAQMGAYRQADTKFDPYVAGAWVLLCRKVLLKRHISARFSPDRAGELIARLKNELRGATRDIITRLKELFAEFGIAFCVAPYSPGAPVHGHTEISEDGVYLMALTIRGKWEDMFWFTIFHELGYIVNGDAPQDIEVRESASAIVAEARADEFACDALLAPDDYAVFVRHGDFTLLSIQRFSEQQGVSPGVVVGRLQKDGHVDWTYGTSLKTRIQLVSKEVE